MLNGLHRPGQPAPRRRAFTLVELLIVLGIIALLLALLFPALGGLRASAQRTRCMANQRQLFTAYLAYAHDNRGHLVHPGQGTRRVNGWLGLAIVMGGTPDIASGALYRYLKNQAPYICPADPDSLRSYSINAYLDPDPFDGAWYWMGRLDQVKRPAATFVFIESNQTGKGMVGPINNGSFAITTAPHDVWRERPGNWHTTGVNLAFADGHTEYMKWNDPRTVQVGYGALSGVSNDLPRLQALLGVDGTVPIETGPCCKDGTCMARPGTPPKLGS